MDTVGEKEVGCCVSGEHRCQSVLPGEQRFQSHEAGEESSGI